MLIHSGLGLGLGLVAFGLGLIALGLGLGLGLGLDLVASASALASYTSGLINIPGGDNSNNQSVKNMTPRMELNDFYFCNRVSDAFYCLIISTLKRQWTIRARQMDQ